MVYNSEVGKSRKVSWLLRVLLPEAQRVIPTFDMGDLSGLFSYSRVLRLVAQGLTNEQIAEQLVISYRTVTTHLNSIYTKLGVLSRSAATRFAVEHQLA